MAGESILVVDDDPNSSAYVSLALTQAGHTVRTAANGVEALLAMEREVPVLVISDLQMPAMGGLELLVHVKERWSDVPVLLLSVEEEIATVVEAVHRGAVNYLVKPVSPSVLQAAVSKAFARTSRTVPLATGGPVSEIVGVSPAILHVRHMVALASRSDVNVIITGETGTGKELAARAIHRTPTSGAGPFVAHNCALTPPEMFDSEFFGHRRGAFTGADRDRVGILRAADGGILFLDELECLSLPNQAKLLRVIDDGEVRPVGSEQVRPVSVRFVAATNRAPEVMLAGKELREDLYYRLRGFQIDLPALRDRREDILPLVDHFLGPGAPGVTTRAQQVLRDAAWPGNVRQLRNAVRSAHAVAGSQLVDTHHLDLSTRLPARSSRPSGPPSDVGGAMSLVDAERRTIANVLEVHGGNLSRAAEALGIHRSTLRRKLRELGLARKGRA